MVLNFAIHHKMTLPLRIEHTVHSEIYVLEKLVDNFSPVCFMNKFLYPRHTKSGGVLRYTLRTLSVRLSIRPSVRLSVSASFPCSNFSIFWPIFFKLCIDNDIGEEWYRIASGLISFWNNSYGPWCTSEMLSASFPCSNFSTFWPIFFRLCIDIGIGEEWYGIASGIISFRNNRVMALDLCPKCIFGQYLKLRSHKLSLCATFRMPCSLCWQISVGL